MAKRKRKTSGRSTASRRKNRTQDRMPAGLITLFAGLVLMALAAVLGPVTLAPPLLAIASAGSQAMALALSLALPQLVWVQLYVAYCVVSFLTLALDDSVKALSARR